MRSTFMFPLLLAVAGLAQASVLTLNPVTTVHLYQQTLSRPCVIGDSSCQNPAGFTETHLTPGDTSYDVLSPLYTVAQIRAIVGDIFMIGVDINSASVTQQLTQFTMSIDTGSGLAVVDTYGADPGYVPPTAGGGNGNGYADYTLNNFTSLAGYASTATVQFHVVVPLVNDGEEQFFLLSAPTAMPEPVSMLLTGAGFVVIGLLLRRRRIRVE